MATKVTLENNILKIETPDKKIAYANAAWCRMTFTDKMVRIIDMGPGGVGYTYSILFSDFEDGDGNNYISEAEIATYLSDKIG